jgi:DNA-binding transcriptional ArsR family regulator
LPRALPVADADRRIEFVVSVSLDLLNVMFFTHLVRDHDEVGGWPARIRATAPPDLLAELDDLFAYPGGQPGLMCALNDVLFAHPEVWSGPDALVRFVEALPDGTGEMPARPGVQGLIAYALRWTPEVRAAASSDREAVRALLEAAGRDPEAGLALYDRPAVLRRRMAALIRRFYAEIYRQEMDRRLRCLGRDVARQRERAVRDVDELMRALTGRPISCLEEEPARYRRFIFTPSPDMGPYVSCADMPPIHGLYYPCASPDAGDAAETDVEAERLAQVYRALGDPQRLRILRLLRGRELYAQEIVERTGLHQSVVSRHLGFMKAVGLVRARRDGAMKFFSLEPAARERIAAALALFEDAG